MRGNAPRFRVLRFGFCVSEQDGDSVGAMNLSLDWLDRYRDFGLLVLRVVVGGTFAFLGWGKLMAGPKTWTKLGGAMGNLGLSGGELYWGMAATFAELLGGIFLVVGVLFRPSALALFVTMAVAALLKFQSVNWAAQETVTGFFYPFSMAAVTFALIFLGGGKFSVAGAGGGRAAAKSSSAPAKDKK